MRTLSFSNCPLDDASGLEPGRRWRAFRAGLRVAPYLSTAWWNGRHRRLPLRVLPGGF